MSAPEMLHAFAAEVDVADLDEDKIPELQKVISVCCGLVTVETETSIVRLVHYTVQEFFEGNGLDRLSGVQIKLSNACMLCLSLREFGAGTCLSSRELRERLEDFPFYDYVSRYWGFHAKCQGYHAEIRRFLSQGEHMAASSQALVRDFYLEEG